MLNWNYLLVQWYLQQPALWKQSLILAHSLNSRKNHMVKVDVGRTGKGVGKMVSKLGGKIVVTIVCSDRNKSLGYRVYKEFLQQPALPSRCRKLIFTLKIIVEPTTLTWKIWHSCFIGWQDYFPGWFYYPSFHNNNTDSNNNKNLKTLIERYGKRSLLQKLCGSI